MLLCCDNLNSNYRMTNEQSNCDFNDFEKFVGKQRSIDLIVNDLKSCHKTLTSTQNIKQFICSSEMTEEQKECSRKLSQALKDVYEKHGHPSCAKQNHDLSIENTVLKIEPLTSIPSTFVPICQSNYQNLKLTSTSHQQNLDLKPIFTTCNNYSSYWNSPKYSTTYYSFPQSTHATTFFQPSCNSDGFHSSTPETSLSQLMIDDLNKNEDKKNYNSTIPVTSTHSLPYPTYARIDKNVSNHDNKQTYQQPLSQFIPYNQNNKMYDPTQSSLSSSLPISQFPQNDFEFFPKSSSFSDFSKKSLDLEEQEKLRLERKRAKNRIAAQKCQQRKIDKINYLENQVSELRKRNQIYKTKTEKLRSAIEALKNNIHLHFTKGCLSLSDYNHTILIPVTSHSGLGN